VTCENEQNLFADCLAHAQEGRVVVFDTETTGVTNSDEIVQIAAAEYIRGERTRTLSVYVTPTCDIHPEAEAAHGLSREFLEENGVAPTEALEQFFDFIGHDAFLVGHNIHFDLRMLQNECRKFGYEADVGDLSFCDTIRLAKRLVPGLSCYRLSNLIDVLGLDGDNSHDALDDTLACGALFFDLIGRIPVEEEYVCERVLY